MKQSLTRKLHLAGGEGLGSRFGLDLSWDHGHPLRRAWSCKIKNQSSKKQTAPKQTSKEKIRRS